MNHLKIEVTEQQKANLLKLADYLEQPKLKAEFDMERYSESNIYFKELFEENCGSVGCAIGHGPYAGIPKIPGEDWREYCIRVFTKNDTDFDFLFDCCWNSIDGTAAGVSKRIRYFLEHGTPKLNPYSRSVKITEWDKVVNKV
jgi:hypothetical protein